MTEAASALDYRSLRSLVRSRARRSGGWLLFVACAGSFLIGCLAPYAPSTPIDMGSHMRWGGWALEAAFVFIALHAAVVAFRALELFFRDHLLGIVQSFPVPNTAIVWDRLWAVLRESWLLCTPALLFSAGVALRQPHAASFASIAFLLVAGTLNALIPVGTMLTLVGSGRSVAQWFAFGSGHSANARAAVFATAPAVGLAAAGFCALFVKLGVEEFLAAWYQQGTFTMTRAATVVATVVVLFTGSLLVTGYRAGQRRFRVMLSQFAAAEVTPPRDEAWVSETRVRSSWWTRRLDPLAGLLVDRRRIEFARCHPFLLLGNYFAAVVLFVATMAWHDDRYLRFLPMTFAVVWLTGVLRVHSRVDALASESVGFDRTLVPRSIELASREYASWILATRSLAPILAFDVFASLWIGSVPALSVGILAAALVEPWSARAHSAGEELHPYRSVPGLVGVGVGAGALMVAYGVPTPTLFVSLSPLLPAALWVSVGLAGRRRLSPRALRSAIAE